MKTISIQPADREPDGQDLPRYLDFLICRLMKLGIGCIEADRTLSRDGKVDFVFTSHRTGASELIGSIPEVLFRPLLARFGPRCGTDGMLYAGHTLFACEHECEGCKRFHRFSLFICNEPTMGVWLRLYLYCIDGVWPMRQEAGL